jgi:tRNA threonylcarbamoyladenosine biosynthesis protein TsaE
LRLVTFNPAETEALGRRLGELLRSRDVVALSGDLGAGKTVLARGIAAGVGASGYIASPTFTFIREYHGPLTVYHVDLYRIERPAQLDDLGLDEILDSEGVVVMEWAEKAGALLPAAHLWIELRFGDGDEVRTLDLRPRGTRYTELVGRFHRRNA